MKITINNKTSVKTQHYNLHFKNNDDITSKNSYMTFDEILKARETAIENIRLNNRIKRILDDYKPEDITGRVTDKFNLALIDKAIPNVRLRNDSLISGKRLDTVINGLETVKKAGIKTIIAFPGANDLDYKKSVEAKGLNYKEFFNYPNSKMNKTVAILPELETQEDMDNYINDVVDFFEIINGNNPNYPLPIYMGCQEGICRTNFVACLNYVFNTQNPQNRCPSGADNTIDYKILSDFYSKLTEQNKEKLGINKNNEFNIIQRLEEINF